MTYLVKERASGRIIARGEPDQNVFKFEGNWYFKAEAVDLSHLKITERTYTCPYKGICYWIDLETPEGTQAQNIAWVYRDPKPGYEKIKDRVAFYTRDTTGTIPVVE